MASIKKTKPARTKTKKSAAKAGARKVVAKNVAAKKSVATKTVAKKSAVKRTAGAKPAAAKKSASKTTTAQSVAEKPALKKAKSDLLDLDAFPRESLARHTQAICLACALDVLVRHLGLSEERAQAEIRRHIPSLEELSGAAAVRPYFAWPAEQCPYCGAPAKWLATLEIIRIEGGKTTDAARRVLLKKLEKSKEFKIIEEKATERDALYSWLAKTGEGLDLDSTAWLLVAAEHWLGRRLPKEDWPEIFKQVRVVRRSRRLEGGSEGAEFEVEGPRLFLAPQLFDEILLIQYLLSRSHKAGGFTFEGRLTLNDLFHRLRGGGYLRAMGITAHNPSEALEQLVELLGGEGRVKFYYVLDRRTVFARLAAIKGSRIPKPKA